MKNNTNNEDFKSDKNEFEGDESIKENKYDPCPECGDLLTPNNDMGGICQTCYLKRIDKEMKNCDTNNLLSR